MKRLSILLTILMLAVLFNGCIKERVAPVLPPTGSMEMQFDEFWSGGEKSLFNTKFNFLFAGSRVWIWNLVLTVEMVIPVASFAEAFNHQPYWDNVENAWIWAYSVPVAGDLFTAKLHGVKTDTGAEWSMYLSKAGSFTDFLWYTGTSNADNTSASWILNKDPLTPNPFIQIDWEKHADGTAEMQYLNIIPGSADNGSYIKFGTTLDPDLDAYYDIYGQADNNLINIKWNQTTHAGRVKNLQRFQDSEWHCWNELFFDVICGN